MARMAEPAHAISRGLLWAEFAALYIGAPLGIALFMPGRLLFPALAVFSGPDAYVHPGWYPGKAEHGRVVPTWNYIAVHAWGPVETFDEPARLLELLARLTARHEAGRPRPWSLDDAPAEYIERQLRAIVGFALPIHRLEIGRAHV